MKLRLLLSLLLVFFCSNAALAVAPNDPDLPSVMPPPTPVTLPEPAGGDCGCLDLVLLVDDTGSMGGAIDNVKTQIAAIIDYAELTCGSVQAALVSFKDDVEVDVDLTFTVADVTTAVGLLTAADGGELPEASDEALREALTEPGTICTVTGDFTTAGYRADCCKLAVLITDALPGGCDDTYTVGEDDVNANLRAQEALGLGVRIGAVFVPTQTPDPDPTGDIHDVMTDYAATSGGIFGQANPDGTGTADAIFDLIDSCAGAPVTELCCLPDGRCLEVLIGDCRELGGTIVDDCNTCVPTAAEDGTWGSVKALYR